MMRPLDCSGVRDAAAEFALGVIDGELRSEVLLHLDHCAPCRTAVSEVSEVADALVLCAPEAEPPSGFQQRALQQMVGADRRRRWRTVKLLAVTAAAVAILSVVTVRVVDESRSSPTRPVAARSQTVAMVGTGGWTVGRVEVVDDGTTMLLALTVDYALPDGEYHVVLIGDSTDRQVLGTVRVTGQRGAWSGATRAPARPARLALVDTGGEQLCTAELPVA